MKAFDYELPEDNVDEGEDVWKIVVPIEEAPNKKGWACFYVDHSKPDRFGYLPLIFYKVDEGMKKAYDYQPTDAQMQWLVSDVFSQKSAREAAIRFYMI
jgi:hypothetical protein